MTTYDDKPKRRLYDLLQSQGLQFNQDITFLSDGGEMSVTFSFSSALKPNIYWTGFTLMNISNYLIRCDIYVERVTEISYTR